MSGKNSLIFRFFFRHNLNISLCKYVCVFLVSVPGRHARIMRPCGLEQICCCNPVPTSDSGQASPRLWVPNSHSLSPTIRSIMPITRDDERIHRQRQQATSKGQTRGVPLNYHNLWRAVPPVTLYPPPPPPILTYIWLATSST